MTDEIGQGESQLGALHGPSLPEVAIDYDNEKIVLSGISSRLLIQAMVEIKECGRTPAFDEFCGDLIERLNDTLNNQVPLDEHAGTRPEHIEDSSEAA